MYVYVCSPDGKQLHLIISNLSGGHCLESWGKFTRSLPCYVSLRNSPPLLEASSAAGHAQYSWMMRWQGREWLTHLNGTYQEVILLRSVYEERAVECGFYPKTVQETRQVRALPSQSGHWEDTTQHFGELTALPRGWHYPMIPDWWGGKTYVWWQNTAIKNLSY